MFRFAFNPLTRLRCSPVRPSGSAKAPVRVFEACSIMLYLAEKCGGRFLPPQSDPAARAECLSWLMWSCWQAPVRFFLLACAVSLPCSSLRPKSLNHTAHNTTQHNADDRQLWSLFRVCPRRPGPGAGVWHQPFRDGGPTPLLGVRSAVRYRVSRAGRVRAGDRASDRGREKRQS